MLDWFVSLLDQVVYSKKVRDAIVMLKLNGDFRPEGLMLTRSVALTAIIVLPLIIFLSIYFFRENVFVTTFISAGSAALLLLILFLSRGSGILTLALGDVCDGKIVSAFYAGFGLGHGWHLVFEFNTKTGQQIQGSRHVQKWQIGRKLKIKPGDQITVLCGPAPSTKHLLYVPLEFKRGCISKSRYQQLANRPFIRS